MHPESLECEEVGGIHKASTEMKAVFCIDIKGMISTSCWDEISSSSGGVIDMRRL